MTGLNNLTLKEALEGITNGEFSGRDVVVDCLAAISQRDSKVRAYLSSVSLDEINSIEPRSDSVLKDLPLALKDNILTKDFKTTASSSVLKDYKPQYNATIAEKLIRAGAFLLGKTNMDAWAHGSSTETSDFGPTLNPWDLTRLPGGSSGGSAAAVAADLCLAAVGTETAGSIRQPAGWCGVVGFKPSYGRVSRYGIVAMASSTDSPGPITKTVWDAAFLLSILAGHDVYDATSLPDEVPDYTARLNDSVGGLKIGVPKEYFEGVENGVSQKVMEAVKQLETLGCLVKEISLLDPKYSIAVYTIIQRSEVSSNLARYDGIRYGEGREAFGPEAKRRIMLGTYALSAGYYDAYYKTAEKVRTLIINDFNRAFSEVDLIAGPVSPTIALPVGVSRGQSMFGEMADVLVEPSSIAGLAGISVPCGFSEGMPVGLDLIGPKLSEELVLRVAYHYEQSTEWHKERPNG
ncbi:MAG: aspartyl/glutamyl-tRNA amidotransferase subunit A [Patescibacteria group bacterium]|nr:aspartyl/glutamyl-tRNA amidotransferase subunit A [Patescibacteria group bacterium]